MKRLTTIFLAAVLLMSIVNCLPFAVSADNPYDYEEDFEYRITDDGAEVMGYYGEGGEVVIPSTLGGYPVTAIGRQAFFECGGITSITFPEGVAKIGIDAFADCTDLAELIVDERNPHYSVSGNCILEKETGALVAGCKTSVIPEGVTEIKSDAFYRCRGLTSVEIPASVRSIGTDAFGACTSLVSMMVDENNPNYYASGNCIIERRPACWSQDVKPV